MEQRTGERRDELVPARVSANWREWWPDRHAALAADVLARWDHWRAVWGLERATPFSDGEVAVVLAVRRADGDAVLKLLPIVDEDLPRGAEARALALWQRHRPGLVPSVLAAGDGGATLLLERIRPGTPLSDAGLAAPELLELCARVARELAGIELEPAERAAFPPLRDSPVVAEWREGLRETPARERRFDDLLAWPGASGLLHIDLHPGNLLRGGSGPGGLCVIDPNPVVGPPEAEIYALLERAGELPHGAARARRAAAEWVARYARAAAIDAAVAAEWTALRARAEVNLARRAADPAPGSHAWAADLDRLAGALGA